MPAGGEVRVLFGRFVSKQTSAMNVARCQQKHTLKLPFPVNVFHLWSPEYCPLCPLFCIFASIVNLCQVHFGLVHLTFKSGQLDS